MDTNVYAPPKSDIANGDSKPGSIVKAVAIGTVIEVTGTILVGMLVGIVYGVVLAFQGISAEDTLKAMEELDPWSGYGLAASFFGLIVSIFAGYTCAQIANTKSYKAAYILSGISLTVGLILGFGSYSWLTLALLSLFSVIAVLLGARLYIRKL